MRGSKMIRTGALSGLLLLCLARPSFAGLPPGPAPPGLSAGICAVLAGAAAASFACDHRLASLRVRVSALRSQQLDGIDPLRVHFSLADLGEYETCQAELRALLAFDPVITRPPPKGTTSIDGAQSVSDHMFVRPVETRPVQVLADRLEHWRQALTCDVHSLFGPKYVLPPACIRAIDYMLKLGDSCPRGVRSSCVSFVASQSAPDASLTPSNGLADSEWLLPSWRQKCAGSTSYCSCSCVMSSSIPM